MPSYRERLRLEGAVLAGCGAVVVVLVLALGPGATDGPASTIVQLVIVAVLMGTLGVRSVRRALDRAQPDDPPGGDGEPTAPWKVVAVVAVLTLGFGFGAGWDAGLRVGGGCVIVGLAQAVLFARIVAQEEERSGRRFHRVPGSSLLTGTRLGAR